MSESSPIKDALYAKIDGIGQEQIHQLLLNNKFSELFERIYEPVIHSVHDIDDVACRQWRYGSSCAYVVCGVWCVCARGDLTGAGML